MIDDGLMTRQQEGGDSRTDGEWGGGGEGMRKQRRHGYTAMKSTAKWLGYLKRGNKLKKTITIRPKKRRKREESRRLGDQDAG